MTARAKAITYGLLLVLAFAAGWLVNGWRFDAVISGIKAEHEEQLATSASNALARYEDMEKTKDEAIKAAQYRANKAEADADRAAATADGLRRQLASVPARISTASRAAVDEYANTAGELLGQCTAEYQQVAEAADQHANNERLIHDAWPK